MILIRYWKPLCALVLAAGLYGWGYTTARTAGLLALQLERAKTEQVIADMAKAEAEARSQAWAKERAMAEYVAKIASQHAQELEDAQAAADRIVADLRDGNLRLRQEWAGCATDRLSVGSEAARSAAEADELRRTGAANLVRIADEADARDRAWRAYAEAISQ